MDMQARKLEFIREFLNVKSEETLTKLEALLREDEGKFNPYSKAEQMTRVQESESDFKAGKYKTSDEILKKYQ